MRDQHFGIEMEMTGLTRKKAAEIIAKHFDTVTAYTGGSYGAFQVKDREGRKWRIVSDGSIDCYRGNHFVYDNDYSVEVVSPICNYEDIEDIQQIVRDLRKGHAKVNNSCGIHIHVDASRHNANSLRNITNIMYSKEDLIYKALNIHVARQNRYCKKVETSFIEELNKKKPKTLDKVEDIWYRENSSGSARHNHYNESRYHALNLHSVFTKGTIEFRLFNATLHAGEIKSYIQFSLAISNQALTQSKASRRKTQTTNEKYTFRTWLLRLGMIGDEFKTARTHLLKHLEGGIAWKDPSQAQAQRERLRERNAEVIQQNEPSENMNEEINENTQNQTMSM